MAQTTDATDFRKFDDYHLNAHIRLHEAFFKCLTERMHPNNRRMRYFRRKADDTMDKLEALRSEKARRKALAKG